MQKTDNALENDRKKIDELDERILLLLNERAKLSVNIARIKSEQNIPIFVPERENNLLDKIVAQNKGPLEGNAIRNIFICILDESKRLQHATLNGSINNKENE